MSKRSRNARATARSGSRQPDPALRPRPTSPAAGSTSTAPARPDAVRRRDRRQPARTSRPMLPLAIGALAVVAIGVIAIALSQGGGTGATPAGSASSSLGSGASVGPATVTGPALARYAEGDDPAVGEPIPEVRGSGFDGTPVTIARDGTPKLLLFLAHWCPHCREEVPKIQDWVDANGMPEGVDFVSIATGINANQPNYPPDAWLAREGWTPPVLVDADDAVAEAYGLAAYPYWVAVNGDGTVAARRTGAVPAEELSGLFEGLRATAPSAAPTVSGSADGS